MARILPGEVDLVVFQAEHEKNRQVNAPVSESYSYLGCFRFFSGQTLVGIQSFIVPYISLSPAFSEPSNLVKL